MSDNNACPYWVDGQHAYTLWGPAQHPQQLAHYMPLGEMRMPPPWPLTKVCPCGYQVGMKAAFNAQAARRDENSSLSMWMRCVHPPRQWHRGQMLLPCATPDCHDTTAGEDFKVFSYGKSHLYYREATETPSGKIWQWVIVRITAEADK